MDPLVILGTGLAGYAVAREWRRLVPEGPLALVTRDAGAFYSKPMLSSALASGQTATTLPNATAEEMSRQLHAEVRVRSTATSVDPAARRVLVDGAPLPYSSLVLALGADPIRLPLGGDGASEVMSVNDIDDYARFRAALEGKRHVLILGAGLIGCEFANDLASAGYEVTLTDPAAWPLSRLLPPSAGEALRDGLARASVKWRLGDSASAVARDGSGYRVSLQSGSTIDCDLILSAIGLRPRTGLAAQAGLAVNRGIVVGRRLQTSDPGVFALGDCAEVEGRVLPFVMPIMHAARALARTLAGEPTEVTYPAMPVVVKTPAWPTVVSPPAPGVSGEWTTEVRATGVRAVFRGPDGRLLGFALSADAVADKNTLTRELPAVLG
jgi:rubredoxin-NAD+ reductase